MSTKQYVYHTATLAHQHLQEQHLCQT